MPNTQQTPHKNSEIDEATMQIAKLEKQSTKARNVLQQK